MKKFEDLLEEYPIIGAVKNYEQLQKVIQTDVKIVFVLYGNLLDIEKISNEIFSANKIGILHIDLIDGIVSSASALQYVKEKTKFQGIISTKTTTLSKCKKLGFYTILRTFLIDSKSMDSLINHESDCYDAIEILPGILYKVIEKLSNTLKKPIITGGLISEKSEVLKSIESGATCISTTNEAIWEM